MYYPAMECQHKSARMISVIKHPSVPGELHRVTFAVSCSECGTEFQFVSGDGGIAFNDERTALSAWVVERA